MTYLVIKQNDPVKDNQYTLLWFGSDLSWNLVIIVSKAISWKSQQKTNDHRYRQGQTCGKIEYGTKILMQKNTMIINIIEDVIVRREYNNICNEASTKTHLVG